MALIRQANCKRQGYLHSKFRDFFITVIIYQKVIALSRVECDDRCYIKVCLLIVYKIIIQVERY